MSYHCLHCRSRFFKTLEVRLSREHPAILRKKRCKRCKCAHFIALDFPTRLHRTASESEWRTGRRIRPGDISERSAERAKALVGEYTGRVRHAAEENMDYLRQVRKQEARPSSSVASGKACAERGLR